MSTAAQQRAFAAASRPLSESMALKPGDTFTLRSKSRPDVSYQMIVTPDGYVVHMGEGCEGEIFNGPLGCYHSKDSTRYVMTTTRDVAIRNESILTPAPISFSDEQLRIMKDSVCKGATDAEFSYFTAVCTRTGLDPFMGQIYAVKRYDSTERREVMAIQIGVDGRRLIAERTDKYAGQDPIEWLDEDGVWSEVWSGAGDHPIAARCSVYRKDWPDHKVTAVCRWDSFVQTYRKDNVTFVMPTWQKMGDHMLGKCTENLALKRAFPAEMSFIDTLTGGYDANADADVYIEPKEGFVDGEVLSSRRASAVRPLANVAPPQSGERTSTPAASEQQTEPTFTQEEYNEFASRLDNVRAQHGKGRMAEALLTVREACPYAANDKNGVSVLKLLSSDYESVMALLKGFEEPAAENEQEQAAEQAALA